LDLRPAWGTGPETDLYNARLTNRAEICKGVFARPEPGFSAGTAFSFFARPLRNQNVGAALPYIFFGFLCFPIAITTRSQNNTERKRQIVTLHSLKSCLKPAFSQDLEPIAQNLAFTGSFNSPIERRYLKSTFLI